MRARCGLLAIAVVLTILGALAPAPLAAQVRVLRGTVVDSSSGSPIAGANILVRGTSFGATTGADGRFTISDLPPRNLMILVRRFGYRFRQIVVLETDTEVRVAMASDPLQLDQVIVTGQATTIEKRNLANAVATVSAEDLSRVSSQSLEHALQGKIAGAVITTNSGAPGGGVQVRMRGVTSINAQSEPLYVVDGVMASNVAIPSNQNAVTNAAGGSNPALTQDAQVNRIADLNPSDIETIEILKGASASAIYGSRASNGVVIITTKRGRTGAAEIHATQRYGFYQLSNTLGARKFTSAAEAASVWGPSATALFTGATYDHEKELAGNTPLSSETLLDISGGSQSTKYFISGAWQDDGGIIKNTGFARQSLRANLNQRFSSRVNLDVGSNIIRTDARRGLTNNDNAGVSFYMVFPFTPSFVNLGQNPDGTWRTHPFQASNPMQTAALMKNDEIVWRYLGSGRLTLDAFSNETHELQFIASGGTDYFSQKNSLFFPPELQFEPVDGQPGTSLLSNSDNLNINVGLSGVHRYTPRSSFSTTTSFGTTYANRDLNIARVVSRNLVGGLEIIDAGTSIGVHQIRQKVQDVSVFAQEEVLTLGEKLLLTAGVNADRSSVNSDSKKMFVYPKLAGSYRLEVPYSVLDAIKFRLAYGESGNQPLYGQKFTPMIATQNLNGLPGLVVDGTVGSTKLAPERQREIEGGFDITMLRNRGTVEFSLFQKNVSDLLLQRTLAPSSGFATEIFNGGKLRTKGVELALQVVPVISRDLQWVFRSTYFSNTSTITELPVPTFRTGGFGTSLGAFEIAQGKSATQIVGNDSTAGDASVVVRKIGDANPDFVMSFGNEVTWRRVRLYGLLDWQKGGDIINLTKFLYDLGQNTADYADPITVNGKATTVGDNRLAEFPHKTKVYVEDGGFMKLRELTLSYELPPNVLAKLWGSGHRATLSLSGRNLWTHTKYTGLDPEVSNFGNQNIARNIDVAPFPPSRSFWFGAEIVF
ncbi:MAG TPA: SusC/RagA family TonB-linked outer membrane protein [Gemmatimonadaceae bacterium]